ncbi:hypothetical protein QYF61_005959 [Mycteria americana]|uniref:Uncharacterized protein n=1 Tax=Mycteria americana TaxID=33587 RepID=A0AAN7SH42_MYCAM|nr:hypothetical protein QYF61_005959 [Mycteria americana]
MEQLFLETTSRQGEGEEAERAGTVQPGEEKAWGDLTNVFKYLVEDSREDRARLFSVVPSDRTRGRWSSTDTGCPEKPQSLQPQRQSKPNWTRVLGNLLLVTLL